MAIQNGPHDGDIILFTGGKKNLAVGLQKVQRALSGKPDLGHVTISHVGLTVASGGFIHAEPFKGVHTSDWSNLRDHPPGQITILRRRDAPAMDGSILGVALEVYGQGYNYLMDAKADPRLAGRLADRVFCSELIEKFYSRESLGIRSRKAFLHPNDFKRLLWDPNWIDVTDLYRPFIKGEIDDYGAAEVLTMLEQTSTVLRTGRKMLESQGVVDGRIDAFTADMERRRLQARATAETLMEDRLRRRARPSMLDRLRNLWRR